MILLGTPGADPEWISAQATLAIRHIVKVRWPPPREMELEVQWQEHEVRSYPTIVLLSEDAMRGTPSNYLERCQVAITAYENGGELPPSWSMPPVCSENDDSDSAFFDPDNAPPDPPDTLNIFENQRYISKLIQWGLEASERRRSRPHLVERDATSQRNPSRLLKPPAETTTQTRICSDQGLCSCSPLPLNHFSSFWCSSIEQDCLNKSRTTCSLLKK